VQTFVHGISPLKKSSFSLTFLLGISHLLWYVYIVTNKPFVIK
jgi:hypothetical protein